MYLTFIQVSKCSGDLFTIFGKLGDDWAVPKDLIDAGVIHVYHVYRKQTCNQRG